MRLCRDKYRDSDSDVVYLGSLEIYMCGKEVFQDKNFLRLKMNILVLQKLN